VTVTGSPRLDALAATADGLSEADLDRARALTGAGSSQLVLVTTKHREARGALRNLLDAATSLADVHVAIKAHPAETPEVYAELVAGRPHVCVLPASAPLAPLLRASRVVVTVNSTVALDAAVLGTPALVIGLPNNLSPFVDAGVMAGGGADEESTERALRQILYDEEFRRSLRTAQREFLARFHIQADGQAAARSAGAIIELTDGSQT
jgi:UDP-N-acetylglucosamine 2-epimerase